MKYLVLIMLLGLTACGKHHDPQFNVQGFEKYVNTFSQEAGTFGQGLKLEDLVIQFGSVYNNEMAQCNTPIDTTPTIIVSMAYWTSPYTTEDMREALLMHELGHCVLYRQHRTDVTPSLKPQSFMYPVAMDVATDDNYYTQNRQAYFQELFLKGPGPTN